MTKTSNIRKESWNKKEKVFEVLFWGVFCVFSGFVWFFLNVTLLAAFLLALANTRSDRLTYLLDGQQ